MLTHAHLHISIDVRVAIAVSDRIPNDPKQLGRPIMPPKLSAAHIDEKLERLHAFVCEHAALSMSRNGLSLRASLRQTASVEERTWYQFLCKNESAFSEPQNNRVLRAYALLAEQASDTMSHGDIAAVLTQHSSSLSMAPRAAVLPEPAAEDAARAGATSHGHIAAALTKQSSSPSMAPSVAVLPVPAADTAAVLQESAAEAAAARPESAAEAVAVPPALLAPDEPELPACKRARSVSTDVLPPLQTGPVLKAVWGLETLPAQHGVDQLRHVLQQWRAAGALVDKDAQRNQLRQVAAELGVPLRRGVQHDSGDVSRAIADGFTARVSALRTFVVSSASAVSGSMTATTVCASHTVSCKD